MPKFWYILSDPNTMLSGQLADNEDAPAGANIVSSIEEIDRAFDEAASQSERSEILEIESFEETGAEMLPLEEYRSWFDWLSDKIIDDLFSHVGFVNTLAAMSEEDIDALPVSGIGKSRASRLKSVAQEIIDEHG